MSTEATRLYNELNDGSIHSLNHAASLLSVFVNGVRDVGTDTA